MTDIMQMLNGSFSDELLDVLGQKAGIQDRDQTKAASKGIMAMLMSQLAKNSSTQSGANSLVSALDRDHDGSILDDVVGLLSGRSQNRHSSMLNGAGILGHLFGGRQNGIVNLLTKMTGLEGTKVGTLMNLLAPIALGALGRSRNKGNMGVSDLTRLLGNSVQQQQKKSAPFGLIGKFLDSDGDGNIADDLAGLGLKALANSF